MENIHILMAGLTAVILFIFGLENFSKEVERISGERFRNSLAKATRIPLAGVALGAAVTAVIQSSSATSVITISLVNAGVISFKSSVGVIFGSNIGTTITAQLVAFKLTAFAPLLIVLGFVLSLLHSRAAVFGKAVFYFGFVFFSLNLISSALDPLKDNVALTGMLMAPQNPLLAILLGCLFTAIVQSSSVTTGLAIIFTQQGLLGLENAVPLIMGANIGTTATAFIAVFNMDVAAKKTALSHFLFNVGGVILFAPLFLLFGHHLKDVEMDPALALAGIHLVFNVATSIIFLMLINQLVRLVDTLLGEGKMDFERLPLPVFKEDVPFSEIRAELQQDINSLFEFLQENYNVVTLSIEANYRSIFEAAEKRIAYVEYLKKEFLGYFSRVVSAVKEEEDSREVMRIITQFDYLFQVHDSINDLFDSKRAINDNYIELQSDILLMIRELSSGTLSLFDEIRKSLATEAPIDIKQKSRELQSDIDEVNRELLTLLIDPVRRDAGALTNFVTYSQRLKDKLVNFYGMSNQG